MISRHVAVKRSGEDPARSARGGGRLESPWNAADAVDPRRRDVGCYGDSVWVFPADRDAGRDRKAGFGVGDDAPFLTVQWSVVAKDLAMALYGRAPQRASRRGNSLKGETVAGLVGKFGVMARWAHRGGHGLPSEWSPETVDAFVLAFHDARLPIRVRPKRIDGAMNPKAQGSHPRTLAQYLNIFAALHEYRDVIGHGMPAVPWEGWPARGAVAISGDLCDDEAATAVIEADVWWACVRAALCVVNVWADDIIDAWQTYRPFIGARSNGPTGKAGRERLQEWAADTSTKVPVDATGVPNWRETARAAGVHDGVLRNPDTPSRHVIAAKVARGEVTRYWWGTPAEVGLPDGSRRRWIDRMDTATVWELATVLRNACLVVLAALSAMRASELMELKRGCVEFHDGAWALCSLEEKHHAVPHDSIWWVSDTAVTAIRLLERLTDGLHIWCSDARTGEAKRSEHLICTLASASLGRAGLDVTSDSVERFCRWIDDNAASFGLDPVGQVITPHQFRRTFAVIAAWQPDGHVAVELQLKDSAEIAAAYYSNRDRRWFEAYELAKAEASAARMRSYVRDHREPVLAGPGGAPFAADLADIDRSVEEAAQHLDSPGRVDAQTQAFLAVGRFHTCGDGWDCAGTRRHARCATVLSAATRDDEPAAFAVPQLAAGLCIDLGDSSDRCCRNVIFDPAVHLAYWDVEVALYDAELAREDARDATWRKRVQLERAGAAANIAEMERACETAPLRLVSRFQDERLRLIERIRDDQHTPGVAAVYRPLLQAQEQRIEWLLNLARTQTQRI